MDYQTFANSHTHEEMMSTHIQNPSNRIRRQELYNTLNGDAFYPSTTWPIYIQTHIRDTPISDTNTFKIFLFFYGNGCSPDLITEYIYTTNNDPRKIRKRYYQIKYICNNINKHKHHWYYFDIHTNTHLHMDGSKKMMRSN